MELKPSAQPSSHKEDLVNTSKRLLENRNWLFLAVYYFFWKLDFFLNILPVLVVANYVPKTPWFWNFFCTCKSTQRFLFNVSNGQTEFQSTIKCFNKNENQQRKNLEKGKFRTKLPTNLFNLSLGKNISETFISISLSFC